MAFIGEVAGRAAGPHRKSGRNDLLLDIARRGILMTVGLRLLLAARPSLAIVRLINPMVRRAPYLQIQLNYRGMREGNFFEYDRATSFPALRGTALQLLVSPSSDGSSIQQDRYQ